MPLTISLSTLEAKRYLQKAFLVLTFPIQSPSLSLQSELIHLGSGSLVSCLFPYSLRRRTKMQRRREANGNERNIPCPHKVSFPINYCIVRTFGRI